MSDIFFDAADEMDYGGVTPTFAQTIADEFKAFLDAWHSVPDVYDDELDAQIHDWYAQALHDPMANPPRGTYFSPSSANSCKRELYEKLLGASRDRLDVPPHQGRWRRLGTAIGDMIQRDVLFAEKHMKRVTGLDPAFTFERDDAGRPMFEEFAKRLVTVDHEGTPVTFYGTCDGIMRYTTSAGRTIRVGLEVKSKQTSYSQTSDFSMRHGPKEDHVRQAVCYGLMYDIDYYIVLYVNASKKAWNMTPDDRAKYPDVRAFGIAINDGDRKRVLDDLKDVLDAVERRTPPKIDLTKWAFNNLKEACARSLSDAEIAELRADVEAFQASKAPDHVKAEMVASLAELTELRDKYAAKRQETEEAV